MWVSYIIGASAPGPRDTRETPIGERTEGYIDPKLESGCDLPGREKEMEEAGSVDLTCSKFAAPVSRSLSLSLSLSLSVVPLLLATLDDLMPTERRRQTDLRRGERASGRVRSYARGRLMLRGLVRTSRSAREARSCSVRSLSTYHGRALRSPGSRVFSVRSAAHFQHRLREYPAICRGLSYNSCSFENTP